jgi:hypothetical protein
VCDDVLCDLYCEYGFATDPATGCPTCSCNPPPTCLPVACDLYCEYGYAVDEMGCETCRCNPPPHCAGEPMCGIYCPYGYATDEEGCLLCECLPPPPGEMCREDSDCDDDELCDLSASLCAVPACPDDEPCPPYECWGTCVPRPECEPLACRLYCEHGYAVDPATGCSICECVEGPPPPPPALLCLSHEDCGDEEICDTSVCYSPPCPPGMACPAVCYGICTGYAVAGYEG